LVQSALFIYLTYVFVIRCLKLSFLTYLSVTIGTIALSSISFFASLLIPDVFAGYTILATTILACFPDDVAATHRSLLVGLLAYSTLVHTSHLALLLLLILLFIVLWRTMARREYSKHVFMRRSLTIVIPILLAALGEIAFAFGAKWTAGQFPVRPPFLMARLIADGPGYEFLKHHCAREHYRVCNYLDRMPLSSLAFLWSTDPKTGVFGPANQDERAALAREQIPFVLSVMEARPAEVLLDAVRNFWRQFCDVSLNEFVLDKEELSTFRLKLPQEYLSQLTDARIAQNPSAIEALSAAYTIVYFLSFLVIASLLILSRSGRYQMLSDFLSRRTLFAFLMIVGGLLLNAAICGILSEPVGRYQARVSWLAIFLALILGASIFDKSGEPPHVANLVRASSSRIPRVFRFLAVGSVGLGSDVAAFTILHSFNVPSLVARLGSLAFATLVTWRLNRAVTFEKSGRHEQDEAVRYLAVTLAAQGTSYGIFAALVLTWMTTIPQVAIVIGAGAAAAISYVGHSILSFSSADAKRDRYTGGHQ
jgi:putative flippase GtrA